MIAVMLVDNTVSFKSAHDVARMKDPTILKERAKVALQLKHLVTPAGMGESFHVLIASKGIAREKVSALAGLSFGQNIVVR